MERSALDSHKASTCVQRIMSCDYCDEPFRFCNLKVQCVDVNLSCDNKPTLSRFMKLKFKESFTWEVENEVHMTHEEVQTIPYFLLDVG